MTAAAIIGMGAITSAGTCVYAGYKAVRAGIDGISPLSILDSKLKTPPLCSQIRHVPDEALSPNRTAALALCASQEALSKFPDRRGLKLCIVAATTVAGMTRSEKFYEQLKKDPSAIKYASTELACHEPAALSGFLCERLDGKKFFTLSTACSTGLHAAGMAKRLIERKCCDLCLAVGADALSLLTIRGFSSLMLLDPSGCRPFDKRRAGISLGEGAGALLLASDDAAELLGAEPLAYLSGWGASADCHHMTAPHPEGEGAKRSMGSAIAEAGLDCKDIDMITTHGTATPDNDFAEATAMRSLFKNIPPFCSLKRTIGHTLAASGIIEAIFAICAIREGAVLPTAGFGQIDDAIGLSPSSYKQMRINHVLKNSFGFGGNNASAVFSRIREN